MDDQEQPEVRPEKALPTPSCLRFDRVRSISGTPEAIGPIWPQRGVRRGGLLAEAV